MISITKEQRSLLEKYINNLDELLSMDDDEELLLAIDDAIIDTLDPNNHYFPNKDGIKMEKIYDQLWIQGLTP